MEVSKLIAKSDGTLLVDHSVSVQKIGLLLYDKLGIADNSLRDEVSYACLFHDIGKSTKHFQDYLSGSSSIDDICIYHHEISWAVLSSHYFLKDFEFCLDSVYWHHSKKEVNNLEKNTNRDIANFLLDDDVARINKLIDYLLVNSSEISGLNDKRKIHVPEYYSKDKLENIKKTIVRSCVITADRIVSNSEVDIKRVLNDASYCESLYNNLIEREITPNYDSSKYDNKRFLKQVEYSDLAFLNKTSSIKATAGFGKTLLGLLWFLNDNKKLIWVCPRNVVAISVYDSILKELERLNINVGVELFLTGKKQKSNVDNDSEFSSDIIVTNIDNYLSPTINNSIRHRLYNIIGCNVIFDEFHELISSDPLFSCFVNLMSSRNLLTNSKTLLLSATPSIMEFLWDGTDSNKTVILPNKEEHYAPAHNGVYVFNKTNNYESLPSTENSLIVMNSISNSQICFIEKGSDILIHSNYQYEDKNKIFDLIFKNYGSFESSTKPSVVSSPIIQASMDISFLHLTDSVMSPETTLQRLGRCDRWGNLQIDKPSVTLFFDSDNSQILKSEKSSISTNYCNSLNRLWIGYLRSNIEDYESYNLEQIYKLYNNFNILYSNEIKEYIKSKYKDSNDSLCKIYPKDVIYKNKGKYKKLTGKLRGDENNIWCIYNFINNSNFFTSPFNIDYSRTTERDEINYKNLISRVHKAIDSLIKLGDKRFNYNKYNKIIKINKSNPNLLSDLRKIAKNIETPYIAFNKVYSVKYGLIKTKIINKFKLN